jgi:hypothetical protein
MKSPFTAELNTLRFNLDADIPYQNREMPQRIWRNTW